MKPRIAIGGIWHETNTFAPGRTTYEDFENYQFAQGDEMFERYATTNTESGGAIGEAEALGLKLHPTLFAAAVPSGTIERSVAERICRELIERIENLLPLDGIILILHGAAVAVDIHDLDYFVIRSVRKIVGSEVPIVATLDFHANVSNEMFESATVLIGYDTYPHIDMAERGREAVRVLARILETGRIPKAAFRKLPLLTVPLKQQTDEFPMSDVMRLLRNIEQEPGIVCGTVAMGFPYSDVPFLGASVLTYADEAKKAHTAADTLAKKIWDLREQFHSQTIPVAEGVKQAVECSTGTTVIVEPADNVGGGSAGDSTGVLKELLEANAQGAVIVIADPESVRGAEEVGTGNKFYARIGGKTDDQHGPTLELEVKVGLIADGKYEHKGSYMTGYVTSLGRTAVVESNGVQIVLTSLRSMPFDAEQLRCVGIEPASKDILVVKSAIAWKAAYGNIAENVIVVDSPGCCAANPGRLNFLNRPAPLYPLETDTVYTI